MSASSSHQESATEDAQQCPAPLLLRRRLLKAMTLGAMAGVTLFGTMSAHAQAPTPSDPEPEPDPADDSNDPATPPASDEAPDPEPAPGKISLEQPALPSPKGTLSVAEFLGILPNEIPEQTSDVTDGEFQAFFDQWLRDTRGTDGRALSEKRYLNLSAFPARSVTIEVSATTVKATLRPTPGAPTERWLAWFELYREAKKASAGSATADDGHSYPITNHETIVLGIGPADAAPLTITAPRATSARQTKAKQATKPSTQQDTPPRIKFVGVVSFASPLVIYDETTTDATPKSPHASVTNSSTAVVKIHELLLVDDSTGTVIGRKALDSK